MLFCKNFMHDLNGRKFQKGIRTVLSIAQKKFIFLWMMFFVSLSGISSDERFVNYSIEKGLPSSQTYDATQLRNGAMLFATDNGIAEYNGYTFRNYDLQDGLTDNTVFNFWPQSDGKIWCSTFNKKLFYYDENKKRFFTYHYNKRIEELRFSELIVITALYIAPDSSLFLSFVNATGYLRIGKNGEVITNTVQLPDPDVPLNTVLFVDDHAKSFFFTAPLNQRFRIDGFNKRFFYSGEQNRGDDFVKAIYHPTCSTAVFISPDSSIFVRDTFRFAVVNENPAIAAGCYDEQRFWIGYRYGGFALYSSAGKKNEKFLDNHSVNNLRTDHEGGIWVTTLDAGLFHRSKNHVLLFSTPDPNDFWVNNLVKDQEGLLWSGYYNGSIYRLQNGSMFREYHSQNFKPAMLARNEINDEVWGAVNGELIDLKNKKKYYTGLLPIKIVFTADSLALLAYRNVLFYNKGVLSSSLITGMRINDLCAFKGKYFLASNKGVFYIEGKTILPAYGFLKGKRITDLESHGDFFVVCTKGSGLFIQYKNRFFHFTKRNGLISNTIFTARIENNNTLWLCTNAGLNRLHFSAGGVRFREITTKDGLPANEVSDVLVDGDSVWVATKNGLCRLPLLLPDNGPVNYFLELTSIHINDKVRPRTELQQLNHKENRIEFFLQGYSYNDHRKLLYRYKLEGLEKNWNFSENRRILYPSLPPGKYRFVAQVKGSNSDWQDSGLSVPVVVHPPFWKTPVFILSTFFLVVIVIYLFFRYNILSYNRDIVRELLRQLLKRLNRKVKYVVFREQGKEIRIQTDTIRYVKSEGNYLEIITDSKKHVVRCKIGDFSGLVPDPLEFLRINRSYIVRIDKISEKGKKELLIGKDRIPVGETYLDQIRKIKF